MKGVILAGGTGSRLHPLTVVTNKHLLPLYNKPVIYYPIEKLVEAGINDILIITSHEYTNHFVRLLDTGKQFSPDTNINYAVQTGPDGLADALRLAGDFAKGEKVVVLLGDNVFDDSLADAVKKFETINDGAMIFIKEHPEAREMGVAVVQDGKVVELEEKPINPKTNLCAVGIYMYNPDVFEIIKTLKPSKRGEYEITDVNKEYLRRGKLYHQMLTGAWFDCGNFFYLLKAGNHIARKHHNYKD